jgi:hypothetical protein
MKSPASTSVIEIDGTWTGLMIPAGRGLCFVLSILASMSRSWYWLRADAPQARRKTAVVGSMASIARPWGTRKKPVAAEQAAKTEMGMRQSVKYGFKDNIVKGRSKSLRLLEGWDFPDH